MSEYKKDVKPRRQKRTGSVRQRDSGYWQAVVRRRGQPQQSKTFRTKTEAEEWARQVEAAIDKGSYVSAAAAERTTFNNLADDYEKDFAPHHYRGSAWKHKIKALRGRLGNFSLTAITPKVITKYRDDRLRDADPRYKDPESASRISGATVKTEIDLLSKMLDVAQKEFGIALPAGNPVLGVRKPSSNASRDRRITDAEWTKLVAECNASVNVWLLPAVRLAVATAMRQGEILSLRWKDVHTTQKVALLRQTKNGEARAVPLSRDAVAVLDALPRDMKGLVFPMPRRTLYSAFSRAIARAEIENLTFHDLRHEALSRLAERGDFTVLELAAVSGHKTLQMLKRYTHLQAGKLAEKMR